MSLFTCNSCGCVENTALCSSDNRKGDKFPHKSLMFMHGFDDNYEKTGVRSEIELLCSECNTGVWHGEFTKKPATDVEVMMGEQLVGDEKYVFTFHPMWREYDESPDDFDINSLKKYRRADLSNVLDLPKILYTKTEPFVRETPKISRNEKCPCGSEKKYKKCCHLNSKGE